MNKMNNNDITPSIDMRSGNNGVPNNSKGDNENALYVTQLERLDRKHFLTSFAMFASLFIAATSCVYMVLSSIETNQMNQMTSTVPVVFGLLTNIFAINSSKADKERKAMRENLNNGDVGKSR